MVPEYENNTLKQNFRFHIAIDHIAVVNDNHSFNKCVLFEYGYAHTGHRQHSQLRRCLLVH